MVLCSSCRQDLDSDQFSKSQKRKSQTSRKCKKCIIHNKSKQSVMNTNRVIFNHYQNLIKKSIRILPTDIAAVIVQFLLYGVTLNGIYEDITVRNCRPYATIPVNTLTGYALLLNENLTFKLVKCERLTCGIYTYDVDKDAMKGYRVIEGMYKCLNDKQLHFAALIGSNFKKIKGEIIYKSTDSTCIKIKGIWSMDGISFCLSDSTLERVDKQNCKLLNMISYEPGCEP